MAKDNGQRKKVHDRCIWSLCEISRNRLVSSSYDKTLKVWDINKDTLTHIKALQGHNENVFKVIFLIKDTIASG